MFSSYLKIAWRNLRKHRIYSLINILGLSVGIAVCLVLLVFVNNELAYDEYHEHKDRVFRVVRTFYNPSGEPSLELSHVSARFAEPLEQEFPEIEHAVRTWYGGIWLFEIGDKFVEERDILFAESDIFDVFTIPMVAGDPTSALADPYTAILSEEFAVTLFGDQNPLGKTFKLDNDYDVKVTGIFKDMTGKTHLPSKVIMSFKTIESEWRELIEAEHWGNNSFGTYVRLTEGTDAAALEAKLPGFLNRTIPANENEDGSPYHASNWTSLHLQPLPWIYMNSHLDSESGPRGNMQYTLLFSFIAFAILLVACVNFMNLATARSAHRAREVGLRKVVGASRKVLIYQFLGESVVIVGISVLFATVLAELFMPYFLDLVQNTSDMSIFDSWTYVPLLLIVWITVSLFAGLYPAFFLSSYKPSSILRGELTQGRFGAFSRRALVVVQFTVSVALFAFVGVTIKQMDYIQSKELGFSTEDVIRINSWPAEMRQNWPLLKDRLLSDPSILSATASNFTPPVGRLLDSQGGTIEVDGEMVHYPVRLADIRVDHSFLDTYGIEMQLGRSFSTDFPTDSTEGYILNEAAVKAGGWSSIEEALGARIDYGGRQGGRIIGIVKDFHFESLHREIIPMIFYIDQSQFSSISVRAASGQTEQALALLEGIYAEYWPNWPFQYELMDERREEVYQLEHIVSTLFVWCAAFAIFIAGLGLLGLAAYTAERRTKEIGIRKTLGASEGQIVLLLNREFALLVGIATVIAWPLAWYGMTRWLETFAYRTGVSLDLFLISGAAALLIALVVVTTQALRAASVHPIKALRHE